MIIDYYIFDALSYNDLLRSNTCESKQFPIKHCKDNDSRTSNLTYIFYHSYKSLSLPIKLQSSKINIAIHNYQLAINILKNLYEIKHIFNIVSTI